MTRNSAASLVLSCAPASTIAVAAAMAGRMFGRSANASWKRRSRSSADRPAMAIPLVRSRQALCWSRYSCTTAQSGAASAGREVARGISGGAAVPDCAMSCVAAASNRPRHTGAIGTTTSIAGNRRLFGVTSRFSSMMSLSG